MGFSLKKLVKAAAAPFRGAVKVVAAPVKLVADVASGKNVGKSIASAAKGVGAGVGLALTGSTAALNEASGGKIAKAAAAVPIIGKPIGSGIQAASDFQDSLSAKDLAKYALGAGVAAGSVVGVGAAASALGLTAGQTIAAGGVASKLSTGDIGGAISGASGLGVDLGIDAPEIPDGVKDAGELIKSAASAAASAPAPQPAPAFNSPAAPRATIAAPQAVQAGVSLPALAVVALLGLLLVRKR